MSSNRRAQSLPPHMHETPPKRERGRCITAICISWKVITCIVSHVTLVLLVVSYCVGGAYLFQHLEKPHEIEVKKGIHNMRLSLTEKIWNHSDNVSVLNENDWIKFVNEDLRFFEKEILTAMKTNGWDGDEDISKSQWTFVGSLFYSIIVITTIGYGHISPRTDWGKVTTIFYAIVGIPLMLLCLSNIGDVMATSFRFIYWRICCYACTRTSKKARNRTRQRSIRGHRYSSRSQPPPSFRRSIKMSQMSSGGGHGGGGMTHAQSDPELRSAVRRDFDYDRHDRRFLEGKTPRGGSDRRQDHHSMMMIPPGPPHHLRGSRHLPPYEQDYHHNVPPFHNDMPSYTQTLNRGARFSSRQRNRDRMRDRHTVERERHLSRSKQQFHDSMEDLQDEDRTPPHTKRAMSVRSRSPTVRREDTMPTKDPRELRELNRLNSHLRGKSMPHPNARSRAKSVDPRLSAARYEEVDDEIVKKTPIISNRYALNDLEEPRESRSKQYQRSQSMPRSAFHKNSLNQYQPRNNHEEFNYKQRQNSPYAPTAVQSAQQQQHYSRRASLGGRPQMAGVVGSPRFGNRLELPERQHHSRRGSSQPRRHTIYDEDYDESFMEDHEDYIHSAVDGRRRSARNSRDEYDYYDEYVDRPTRQSRDRRPKKEKQERLPPSPRIMSPMGFAVKRQVRRRPSYDYDDDSMYGDEWSDYYGDISPKDRPVPIWLCVFLVISYILGGAALFAYWEKWSFLDSAYFCFITLTTIGFGDFVPAKGVKDESEQSIAYCSLYLLFGIALLAMSFNLVQEEFIANVKEVARRLGILKDDDDEDD